MSISFLDHSAEREGLLHIEDSLTRGPKAKSLGQVRHLFINPHGSIEVPPVPGLDAFLSRHSSENLRRYLAVEKDFGIPEFRNALLAQVPDALAVSFKVNRGLTDPNRTRAVALRNIVAKAPEQVREELLARHDRSLAAVDEILAQLSPDVKISLLHSTEPFDDADQSIHELDLSDPVNLERFLQVRTNVGEGHGPVTPVVFITGKGDEPTRDDLDFRRALQRRLDACAIPYAEDVRYSTRQGVHKTSDYMRARPGDVNAVDWPRDLLMTGEVADGMFSLSDSVADPRKIQERAGMFAEALREVSRV